MEEEYLCKDCKHSFVKTSAFIFSFGKPSTYLYRCRRAFKPKTTKFDPVYGTKAVEGEYLSCRQNRQEYGECKKAAKFWAPKHKKDLFKALVKEHND